MCQAGFQPAWNTIRFLTSSVFSSPTILLENMENKLKKYLIEIRKLFEDDTTRKSIMDGKIEYLSDAMTILQYFGGWLIHRTEDAPMRPGMPSIDALKQAGLGDCYNTVQKLTL